MPYYTFIGLVIFLISLGLKAEKKKKEIIHNSNAYVQKNRAAMEKRASGRAGFSPVKKEESILEKATRHTEVSKPEHPSVENIEPSPLLKEEISLVSPLSKTEKKENRVLYHDIFDGFAASDALYLARKDALEERNWA